MASKTLGKYTHDNFVLLQSGGWEALVRAKRTVEDLHDNVGQLPHPAAPLLHYMCLAGIPVPHITKPWTQDHVTAALDCGLHQSCELELNFFMEEFLSFHDKRNNLRQQRQHLLYGVPNCGRKSYGPLYLLPPP